MSQTCPYDLKTQYLGFLRVQVTEWVNSFLWIILGLCLLIESSLVRLQRTHISQLRAKRASNGSCCCWKFLRQFACPDAYWLQYTSRFSACGTALQGHTKSFRKKHSTLSLFAYKVSGYLLWENPAAFQSLQLCSSLRCKQKRFVWPCSKLFWLCLSC